MYLVKVDVRDSRIDGKGVFAIEDVKQDTVVWKFDPSHDKSLSLEDFDVLDDAARKDLLRVAYLSTATNHWVYPPENDSALFTNHSEKNNLAVSYDPEISEEIFFKSNRDIKAGEELTVNYKEFDARSADKLEIWL
jgi:SET domain-containing protein